MVSLPAKGQANGQLTCKRASQWAAYLQKLIQDDPQAPDVNSRAAVLLALDNLRSRELRSSTQLTQVARERRRDACQPKISNFDIRGFIHQNVLWLQISVNHPPV